MGALLKNSWILFKISSTLQTNSVINLLRKIPLLEHLIPVSLYRKNGLKQVFALGGLVKGLLGGLIGKSVLCLLMLSWIPSLLERNPLPEEKEACWEYLKAQIDILKPKIILLCGNVAVQSILPNIGGITKVRGKWFQGNEIVHGAKLMPIFHPSYLLRNDSREKGSPKWLMWQDIQEIKREYDKL